MDTFGGVNWVPNSLQKYNYAIQDPINNTDPSGNFNLTSITSALRVMGQLVTRSVTNIGRSALRSFNRSLEKIGKLSRDVRNGLKPKKKVKKGSKKDEVADDLQQFMVLLEAKTGLGYPILTSLADTPRLNAVWNQGVWVKMEWKRRVSGGKIVVIHWFRNLTTDQNVEFKFKRRR